MVIQSYEALIRRRAILESMSEDEIMKAFFERIHRMEWKDVTSAQKIAWREWYRKTRAKIPTTYFLNSWIGKKLIPHEKGELSVS